MSATSREEFYKEFDKSFSLFLACMAASGLILCGWLWAAFNNIEKEVQSRAQTPTAAKAMKCLSEPDSASMADCARAAAGPAKSEGDRTNTADKIGRCLSISPDERKQAQCLANIR